MPTEKVQYNLWMQSIDEVKKVMFVVDKGVNINDVVALIQESLSDVEIEQIITINRFDRNKLTGFNSGVVYDNKSGPLFNPDSTCYLVTFRQDFSKPFIKNLAKIAKEAKEKAEEEEARKAAAEESKRLNEITELRKRLDRLTASDGDWKQGQLSSFDNVSGTGAEPEASEDKAARIDDAL